MAVKTHSIGVYRAGENHVFLRPRMWKAAGSKPGIIATPGRGAGAGQPTAVPYFGHVTEALAAAGFPVLAIQGGASLYAWGSPDSVAAVEAGRVYLEAQGAPAGGVFLLGISMGNLALLNWGRAHPTLVKAYAGAIPAVDLAQHYSANTPSNAATEITTAYGGAPPASSDPRQNPGEITWPMRLYTSSDDPSTPPAWAASFATAVGSNAALVDTGAHGHSPLWVDASDVVSFFSSNV